MANLVKLKKVVVYTAMTADAAECWDAVKLLNDNNIPFQHLNWTDSSQLQGVFDSLATWNYSPDGVELVHKTFTKLPIVHWEAVYDDDNVSTNAAMGLTELQNSQLLANLDKVVRPLV
jgi:hypothetical protein